MKRLLLGVAFSAFAANSFAQTQADYDEQTPQTPQTRSDETDNSADFYSSEIIVTADRIGYSNRDELTAPVTVLTEMEIRNRNQAYITDLLRTVPGLAVSQSGGGGSLTNLRLRGSEANHTLILIDGVEVNNPTDGGFDFGGLRSEDVVKIEVLRGEQSALYGSDTIGGVINIITRAGSSQENFRASVEAGSRETLEGQFSGVVPLGSAALSINGNAFTTEGYDVSGLDGEKDGADSRRLSVGLNRVEFAGIRFSANGAVNLRSTDYDEDTDFDGFLDNVESETDVKTTTARVDARFDLAGFDHLIQSNRVETVTDTKSGFPTLTTGTRNNASWAAKRTFSDRHDLSVLGEYEREEYEFDGDPDVPNIDNYALAADYHYRGEAINITGSIRHDINDVFADATTWRVGAGYKFGWNGRLRASVGTGVKNPTLVELFGFNPVGRFMGNPDLKPENSLGYSIGYEQSVGGLTLSADYFRSELEDEITTLFNPDFTSTAVNLATDSTREGIELAAQWDIGDILYLSGSASFLDSDQDGIEEIRRPEFLASASATWNATDNLSLTVNADHNGSQLDTNFGTFTTVELDSYTLIGANVRYAVSDIVSVYLRGTNLSDEDYQEVFGYASEGRGVFAGVSADF